MNYRHRIEFGAVLSLSEALPEVAPDVGNGGTSASADLDALTERAQLAEQLGLDLLLLSGGTESGGTESGGTESGDSSSGDTESADLWTTLTWVAGKTGRILLVPLLEMSPFPLDNNAAPTMLAHAAASLDLLSGGRLELALTGQSPEHRAEVIEIVRGLLDTNAPEPFAFKGTDFTLDGAPRGPLPAHHLPIWTDSDDYAGFVSIGKHADGWIFSCGKERLFGGSQDIQAANKLIDESAVAAGREASDVRRIARIPARKTATDVWVAELLPLVVDSGVATFVLEDADEETLRRFATEVRPALRAAANQAMGEALPTTRTRSSVVRSKRIPGLAYDSVPESLADIAIEPGDIGYPQVKSTYARGGAPGIVFPVRNNAEVADALAFARAHPELPLGIRSAGHGISGRSTNHGGIVISLKDLNQVEVIDQARRRVRIGAGARWMDVALALYSYGWALTSGDSGGVGVGGLATTGGIGWLARKHGLTIDHLRAVEMVLADGSVVQANSRENPELFWAVRGAGANFGVVTSFEFEVDAVVDVGWGQLVLDASDPADLLVKWGAAVESAPRDLTSQFIMGAPRPGQAATATIMAMVDNDNPDTIVEQLQPLANIAPLQGQRVTITPYAAVMANASDGDHDGQGSPIGRSGLIEHLTPEFAAAAARLIASGAVHFFQIRAVGGAVADVPPDATAYGFRSANFSVAAFGSNAARLNALWDQDLYQHFDGLYLSFDTDERSERIADAFPPATLARLKELKVRYDPDNVFRDNFNIKPSLAPESSGPESPPRKES